MQGDWGLVPSPLFPPSRQLCQFIAGDKPPGQERKGLDRQAQRCCALYTLDESLRMALGKWAPRLPCLQLLEAQSVQRGIMLEIRLNVECMVKEFVNHQSDKSGHQERNEGDAFSALV